MPLVGCWRDRHTTQNCTWHIAGGTHVSPATIIHRHRRRHSGVWKCDKPHGQPQGLGRCAPALLTQSQVIDGHQTQLVLALSLLLSVCLRFPHHLILEDSKSTGEPAERGRSAPFSTSKGPTQTLPVYCARTVHLCDSTELNIISFSLL